MEVLHVKTRNGSWDLSVFELSGQPEQVRGLGAPGFCSSVPPPWASPPEIPNALYVNWPQDPNFVFSGFCVGIHVHFAGL
jgi:hypothetical protein